MAISSAEYKELFLSKDGRNEIARNLKNLMNHKGWALLMLHFQSMIEAEEVKLHDIEVEMTAEDLQKIRLKLYYMKEMMQMPERLAREVLSSEDSEVSEEIY